MRIQAIPKCQLSHMMCAFFVFQSSMRIQAIPKKLSFMSRTVHWHVSILDEDSGDSEETMPERVAEIDWRFNPR